MTRSFAETLLFSSVAINAALMIFFAGIFAKMMNAMDGADFKNLIVLLIRYSSKSPFMIIVLNLPFIGAIPYYCFYGFSNWWITAGLILWLAAGSLSKMIKLPVYKEISTLSDDDAVQLNEARNKVNRGNLFQAVLYSVATILMAFGLR
jgi:hypothetical protein